jgi:hypothetical protein
MKSAHIPPLVLAVMLGVLPRVSAHEGATGIVKLRMDAMASMSHAMKAIGKSIEANRNLAAIQDEAGRIRDVAVHIRNGFRRSATPSRPPRCRRWSDFQAKAAQLERESVKLGSGR